ncbi:hypothetical protein [Aeoliella sp.]|uniref:hypothetical protein n=1 Tax=Aeoliella sp. TaxID=2795800 RepID=UPI003CCC2006
MPLDTPWDDGIYRCVKCNSTEFKYYPFCGFCGAKQPSKARSQALGYTQSLTTIGGLQELATAIAGFNGFAVRLWEYCVTHRRLRLHFYRTGDNKMVLTCSGTSEIHLSTVAWVPDLDIRVETIEDKTTYFVYDRTHEYFIRSEDIVAHLGVDSAFLGDGLCPR